MSYLEGFLLGLGTVVFIGPVFFVVLNNTLKHGKLAGFFVSIGIVLSDIVYIALYKLALFKFIEPYIDDTYAYLVFIAILVTLGFSNLVKPVTITPTIRTFENHFLVQISKGFSINFFNPFVALFWVGVFKYSSLKFTNAEQFNFLCASLLGIFLIDMLRILFSSIIKTYLTPKILRTTHQIIGVLFLTTASILVFKMVNY